MKEEHIEEEFSLSVFGFPSSRCSHNQYRLHNIMYQRPGIAGFDSIILPVAEGILGIAP